MGKKCTLNISLRISYANQLKIPEKSLHLVVTYFMFVFNILDEHNSLFFCRFITTYHKLPIEKGG
jgi:hypothetical protein